MKDFLATNFNGTIAATPTMNFLLNGAISLNRHLSQFTPDAQKIADLSFLDCEFSRGLVSFPLFLLVSRLSRSVSSIVLLNMHAS